MRGVIRVIPNNEEVESETKEPAYGYEIPTLEMSDTITRDIVSCLTYTRQRGEATEPYSLPTAGRISGEVGRPLPSKTIGDEVVRYVGICGTRLEIGAVGTNVTREWLLPRASTGGTSEDTTEPRIAFEDILSSVLGPNIAILRAKVPKPSFETYIEWINKPGYRSEPMVKGKGVPVWVLVSYATKHDMSSEKISRLWNGYVTDQEVQAALAYWQMYPEVVEDKLSEGE